MTPRTKEEWTVILDLFKLIRTATNDERKDMLDRLRPSPASVQPHRLVSYRALLVEWMEWNAARPDRKLLPLAPVGRTKSALACDLCKDIDKLGGLCEICGREMIFYR